MELNMWMWANIEVLTQILLTFKDYSWLRHPVSIKECFPNLSRSFNQPTIFSQASRE